jgi:Flp pilus assembly protein TadG
MLTATNHHRHRSRRGATTVEFAVTSSIIFAILFAGIEFTRVNTIGHTLDNAVYEGARQAILPGSTADEVKTKVQEYVTSLGIAVDSIQVTPSDLTVSSPTIKVTATVGLDRNSWGVAVWFKGQSITRSCELTRELSQ